MKKTIEQLRNEVAAAKNALQEAEDAEKPKIPEYLVVFGKKFHQHSDMDCDYSNSKYGEAQICIGDVDSFQIVYDSDWFGEINGSGTTIKDAEKDFLFSLRDIRQAMKDVEAFVKTKPKKAKK